MPPSLGRPTRRVTMHLFADDVAQMERRYGRGWTEQVRLMVANNCKQYLAFRSELDLLTEESMEPFDGQ